MELSEGIRKIGFRRWYERQLVESHLYFVSSLLCLVAVLASLEGFSLRTPWWETILRFAVIAAGSFVFIWTLCRYLLMLRFAQQAAGRSVCEKCAAYGAFELIGVTRYHTPQDGVEEVAESVDVRCRKCGHQWTLP
jgi:hypothetical protein